MPYTINGIGTNLCKARGVTPWGDCDAVECFTFLYVPILPFKAVHTYNYSTGRPIALGDSATYQQMPIRWSLSLLFGAFARRWFGIIGFAGGMMLFVAAFGWWDYFTKDDPAKVASGLALASWLTSIGLVFLLAGLALLWLMKQFDRRHVNIRYVLGCHAFGSSDPVHWPSTLLETLPGPQAIFNAPSYAQAVEEALNLGDWTGAMWAARLCTALENASNGEALTDRVLSHTHVQAALAAVKLNVQLWSEQMTAGKGNVELWPAPANEAAAQPETAAS